MVGHLTSATRFEPGATFAHGDAKELRAEAEIAIVVGEDGAIAGYGAAIELVDVGRPPPSGLDGIVAENVFHRAFVLGPQQADPPPGGVARLLVGGEVRESAPASADFAATVSHVARHLAAAGERLEAGDVIIAGALAHVPVTPGDDVEAEIPGLGRIGVAIRP